MLLKLSTWQEIEAYLDRSTGVMIPIGSTEQHGPNGLIGTDAICPEYIAQGIAGKIDVLVAPTIAYGMSQHHMAFTGTVSLKPSTLIALVMDVVESLGRHGFKHFYFLNGHGGNIAPVTTAFNEIYARASAQAQPGPRCRLANWWINPKVKGLADELFGEAEGMHATASEVSLSYFAYPEAAKQVSMQPGIAASGTFYDAADFRRKFPDGRVGSDPSLASIEAGEGFYDIAVGEVADDYLRFIRAGQESDDLLP
ncbi:MAG: creatininase family protein [Mariprofundaceae bacterium]